jgi:EAL domain-containing protein (putative c-di-GMP-specific phosphodiesterase class I)
MAFLLMHGLRVHIKLGPIHFIPVAENMSIVDAIILLGHRMKLCVTAEGVETKEQLDCLVDHGCDKAQGYYFSNPSALHAEQSDFIPS